MDDFLDQYRNKECTSIGPKIKSKYLDDRSCPFRVKKITSLYDLFDEIEINNTFFKDINKHVQKIQKILGIQKLIPQVPRGPFFGLLPI